MKEYSHKYFLTAGECNPELEMPLPLIVSRLIEVATEHANGIGAGYADLLKDNLAWVLSRVTIEMKSYPRVNENYTFVTWIEGYNRHFSERNFAILDKDGNEVGFARTIWSVIDISKRVLGDISKLQNLEVLVCDRICPIQPQSRLKPVTGREKKYEFQYVDTDVNRHVNSVRYVELMMNQWTLEHYDEFMIHRFEISFIKECVYGMNVAVVVDETNPGDAAVEINHKEQDGVLIAHCRARFVFEKRK